MQPMSGSRSWPAVLTLLGIATIIPELTTGNTPLPLLIQPGILVYLLLAYGLPVWALRELSVRLGIGPLGLAISGLAYGILNEGLLAKTIFREALPISSYDGYATALGVSWAWAAFITSWHAVASVLLPIALTHALFPRLAASPWARGWVPVIGVVPIAVIGVTGFFSSTGQHQGSPLELIALFATMTTLVVSATRVRSTWREGRRASSLLAGLAGFPAVATLAIIAAAKVDPLWWTLAWLAWLGLGWLTTRRGASSGWLAGGFYVQTAALPLAMLLF